MAPTARAPAYTSLMCPEYFWPGLEGGSDEGHYGGSKSKIEVGSDTAWYPQSQQFKHWNEVPKRWKSGRVISLKVGESIEATGQYTITD